MSESEIRRAVKGRYSKIALTAENDSCCGVNASCCSSSPVEEVSVPVEAESVNAGCGSPLTMVSPKSGDVVLDLGSGGGVDVFRASQMVGPGGKAMGVDATPEMVWRARETKAKYGDKYANAEFRLGRLSTSRWTRTASTT
jgi:arsenite methyltransferase